MIFVVILVVGLGYGAVCILAGFGDPGGLDDFSADKRSRERRYRQPMTVVADGYRAAARLTPGMRLVQDRGPTVLIDLRPTARILGGDFGQVLRLRYIVDGDRTNVLIDSRDKVSFAWANHETAFRQAESALSMRAKRAAGLEEIVPGSE